MKNIVYIAGCWDLFHYGHLRILKKASKLGRLIVGVATDDYIRRYKKRNPIIHYKQRKIIIENLKGVEKAIPHDERKSVDVYDREKITILVIGSDYTNTKSHKERIDEAKKRNIKIKVFKTTKGISTTIIRNRM